jgi:hypothetical protein
MAQVLSSKASTATSKTTSALILLDSGEFCEIVVTDDYRVTVSKKHADGRQDTLYNEAVAFRSIVAALGLSQRYYDTCWPCTHFHFELDAFGRAILNCQNCATVTAILHEATEDARRLGVVYRDLPMPPPAPRSTHT